MYKFLCLLLTAFIFSTVNAQTSRTFTIEHLSKPVQLLPVTSYDHVLKNHILSSVDLKPDVVKTQNMHIPYDIVARNKTDDSLVYLGNHPFFNGMYKAFGAHRPFVLSPDMIWLLISQGFAIHVINNAEALRNKFVHFSGKTSLIVQDNRIKLDDPNSPWEEVFPQFTKQIGEYTGKELIHTLTAGFSTTTPTTRVASQITIMDDALKPYFTFTVVRIGCGIPSITLEGTTDDWKEVFHKAEALKKYNLGWWINKLDPILKQFIAASKGHIDTTFWQAMFKHHTEDASCGNPGTFDGWIIKFFPYDKDGKRTHFKPLHSSNSLPSEMTKIDLKYILQLSNGQTKTTPLMLWAGFTGLEQDTNTFALKPAIGWMIRKKDTTNNALKQKLKTVSPYNRIDIRVKQVPRVILHQKNISYLNIHFTDSIIIPDAMQKINIRTLKLNGKIQQTEINRLISMFPKTSLFINGKYYKTKEK